MIVNILVVWSVLILVPILPIFLLYVFFERKNFFNLQDLSKGIVASGPIAAYVALVLIGWQIYINVLASYSPQNPMTTYLEGDWEYRSNSFDGRISRVGNFYIRNDKGRLILSGDFRANGKRAGNWESEMVMLKENQLSFLYTLVELKEGEHQKTDGFCKITFGKCPVSEMSGIWVVIGEKGISGEIYLIRKKMKLVNHLIKRTDYAVLLGRIGLGEWVTPRPSPLY